MLTSRIQRPVSEEPMKPNPAQRASGSESRDGAGDASEHQATIRPGTASQRQSTPGPQDHQRRAQEERREGQRTLVKRDVVKVHRGS